MPILIKDMEMPRRCFECPVIDTTEGLYCSIADKDLRKEHGINLTRPDWCPLVEIKRPRYDAALLRDCGMEE